MKKRIKTTLNIQGHRGCRGLFPENSLPAFQQAILLGVHTLEMDVVLSADYQVVVSHEPFISRIFCLTPDKQPIPESMDMKYNLFEMLYDEIRLFDCGSRKHPGFPEQKTMPCYKPLLREVFTLAEQLNPNIKYNIEIKSKPVWDGTYTPYPEAFVKQVLEVVDLYKVSSRTNLQAFDVRILEQVKKQAPAIPIALLVDEKESISEKLHSISFKPEIISPYFQLLTKELVQRYQALGYKIIPWTVNDNADLQRMIAYKVDGIITDYPNRLL